MATSALNELTVMDATDVEQATDLIAEPSLEIAQFILRSSPNFKTATNLLCTCKHWAAFAADDSTWKILATLIAEEAHLHYDPPTQPPTTWRAETSHLFAHRGTFIGTFGDAPAPPPPTESFSIRVGCRFRPPGGAAIDDRGHMREVVLPLHQRLRLLQEAHNCTLSEARRRLWSGDAASGRSDPWGGAAVEEAVADVSDAAACMTLTTEAADDDKENSVNSSDPPTSEEEEPSSSSSLAAASGLISLGNGTAIVCAPGAGIRAFDFAYTWGEGIKQRDVYDDAVKPLVDGVLNGRSACVLAYGQTGAGKSHTMSGDLNDTNHNDGEGGLVPRAIRALLAAIDGRTAKGSGLSATVSLACVEVFGDEVTDLLSTEGSNQRVGGFWQGVSAAATAAGYADTPIHTVSEALDLLTRAEGAKRRAATLMNERSSRAHSLTMVTIEQMVGEEGRVKSTLCLADLGGCEKVKRSGARGERLQEAIYINQGLLALKNVVTALNQQKDYVPFQDAKLTMLLRRSLSGGAQTCVVLAARPEAEHAAETLQALRFGESAMQVEVGGNSMMAANGRAAAAALESLDKQVDHLEKLIIEKERFETRIERRKDQRAGLLDQYGAGAALTDFEFEEKKVSVIVGAEKERAMLEKVLAARRALLGE